MILLQVNPPQEDFGGYFCNRETKKEDNFLLFSCVFYAFIELWCLHSLFLVKDVKHRPGKFSVNPLKSTGMPRVFPTVLLQKPVLYLFTKVCCMLDDAVLALTVPIKRHTGVHTA